MIDKRQIDLFESMLSPDMFAVVDYLVGPFILERCMGKNDMAVANGMMLSALILVRAHCKKTGHDYDEMIKLVRDAFDGAVEIVGEGAAEG